MTPNERRARRSANALQQGLNVPMSPLVLNTLTNIPCPKCRKKVMLKLEEEQPKPNHTLGLTLNYRCMECDKVVEVELEF